MSSSRMQLLLQRALAEGVLTPGTEWPRSEHRPWPVALATALGAWMVAFPLVGLMALVLWSIVESTGVLFVAGLCVSTLAVALLRRPELPLFVEQFGVALLLAGALAVGVTMFVNMPWQGAALLLAAGALVSAAYLPQPWLRALLAAVAVALAVLALTPDTSGLRYGRGWSALWLVWHLALLGWLGLLRLQQHALEKDEGADVAAVLEPMAAGWLLATLCGLAAWSGMTMLLGAIGPDWHAGQGLGAQGTAVGLSLLSTLLALAAAARLAWAWPSLRRPWCAAVALVPMALAWFLPTLGAVLLALAWCASSHRWRLATVAALAAAWIVGSFYYRLDWSLAHKALVLAGAGGVLGALARWAPRGGDPAPAAPDAPSGTAAAAPVPPRRREYLARAGIALTALAVLGVVNVGIWQKEKLIAEGEPVLVELLPVDPRSLLQGDYMTLNLSARLEDLPGLDAALGERRPVLVARRDERGVATLQRRDDGQPLAKGEFLIELTPKNGRWTIVTDAWFFKEGEAERWAPARYGEFRVDARGKALLVGLRDAALQPL